MRALRVQLQPGLVEACDPEDLVVLLRAAADGVLLSSTGEDRGDDAGPYINLEFSAPDFVAGWTKLQALFDQSKAGQALAKSTIVACEGEHGWDDYLLLHHFDSNQPLDDPSR